LKEQEENNVGLKENYDELYYLFESKEIEFKSQDN